ncbi:MAG: TRAP transporter small permease [Rubripirellula sp.]
MNGNHEEFLGTKLSDSDSMKSVSGQPDSSQDVRKQTLPFEGFVRGIVLVEKLLSGLFLLIILSTMAAHVIARYLFDDPFQWSEEVAKLALIWMTFISAAFVMAEHRHIAVDMITSKISDRVNLMIECVSYVIIAFSCLLLLIGGANFVWYVGKVGSPALGVPKSFWYGAGMAGLLLMAMHAIVNLVQVILTGKPIPRETQAEEEALRLEMEQSE